MADRTPNLKLTESSFTSPAHRVPTGGLYQPDRLAGELPPNPDLDDTPDNPETVDIRRVARRLVVAFVAIAAIGVVNYTVLRRFSADLHPAVLLGTFGVILTATIISMAERRHSPDEPEDPADCGCAVGMCSGPRPIGELSRRAQTQRPRLPRA